MEIELLKRIMSEQAAESELELGREGIVERDGLEHAKQFLRHPNVLAVLGVRRCGKSVFSRELARQSGAKSFGCLNFDDERLLGFKASELDGVLQAFYELYGDVELVVLDEPQNVDGWELFANRLRRTKKVIVTGSSSQLLSGELATHLTGRHVDYPLYPLSFKETIGFAPDENLTKSVARARKALSEYARGSGFPEYKYLGPSIVPRIYDDIVTKDCLRRHEVRETQAFREIARFLASNYACEFTYSKLAKSFGIGDVNTAKNYVNYLKEAFLIVALERFSPKLKEQAIAPKKAYAIDQGICNFVAFKTSSNSGRLYENMACIELLRRKAFDENTEVYYWRDHAQNEVDFVVRKNGKTTQLIQACYDASEESTRKREENSLLAASRELKCGNLLVLTGNEQQTRNTAGKTITYTPLWKWLLQTSANRKERERINEKSQ